MSTFAAAAVPQHWQRQLGGTMREQLAHLADHVKAVDGAGVSGGLKSVAYAAGRLRARCPKIEVSDAVRARILARGVNGWKEPQSLIAKELHLSTSKIKRVRLEAYGVSHG